MTHILLSEIAASVLGEGTEPRIVITQKTPSARLWKVVGQFTLDEFVEKYGEKDKNYYHSKDPNIKQYFAPGNSRGPAPILFLVDAAEKKLNNGLSAEEAEVVYAKQGKHNTPIFRVNYRKVPVTEDISSLSEENKRKIVITKRLPGRKGGEMVGQYTFEEFVKKFGDKNTDYSRGTQSNRDGKSLTIGNFGGGTAEKHGNAKKLGTDKYSQLGRKAGESHPIYDLIQKVEKGLNKGLSADEADSTYPRMGHHNIPVFFINYR